MANQYRSVLTSSGPAPTGGDALPAEVLSGKTFTNDNGAQTGTMTNNGAVTQTLSVGQSYTIPEGYHNGYGVISASNTEYNTLVPIYVGTSYSGAYEITGLKQGDLITYAANDNLTAFPTLTNATLIDSATQIYNVGSGNTENLATAVYKVDSDGAVKINTSSSAGGKFVFIKQ